MVVWALEIEKRRGRRIAIVALARKMAGILYALLRDGSRYDASRGAAMQVLDEPQHRRKLGARAVQRR